LLTAVAVDVVGVDGGLYDGGGGGIELMAPIVVGDGGGKDAIAAAAIDRRHSRR